MKKSHIILVASVMLGLLMGCSKEPASTGSGEKVNDPTGGGEKVVEHYPDGQKKSEGYGIEDGTKVGRRTFWHENGQKAIEGECKEGYWEGPSTSWYPSGQKSKEGEFKDGKQEGQWIVWDKDGSIDNEKSGIYKADKKVAPLPKKD